ncbi:hypothetical protein BKA69DRAFT_549600 [Paraphysoderma sedebokerense]|nr:hypothetical protein BKA69DRAFT_549600 [Paraphysoderma sedebokerense]
MNLISVNQKKVTARQQQYARDNEKWEANRMLTSGVVQRTDYDADFEEDQEDRVHILVHDIRPPFLDGRQVFTKQMEAVQVVKDITSDMAKVARAGSQLVRDKRQEQERKSVSCNLTFSCFPLLFHFGLPSVAITHIISSVTLSRSI